MITLIIIIIIICNFNFIFCILAYNIFTEKKYFLLKANLISNRL